MPHSSIPEFFQLKYRYYYCGAYSHDDHPLLLFYFRAELSELHDAQRVLGHSLALAVGLLSITLPTHVGPDLFARHFSALFGTPCRHSERFRRAAGSPFRRVWRLQSFRLSPAHLRCTFATNPSKYVMYYESVYISALRSFAFAWFAAASENDPLLRELRYALFALLVTRVSLISFVVFCSNLLCSVFAVRPILC